MGFFYLGVYYVSLFPSPITRLFGFAEEDMLTESNRAFLAVASYLIFGSWLNYHRYGARGWDLLPHSDLIRDIPYLLRDVIRRVLNTVQISGSRGGYSAV